MNGFKLPEKEAWINEKTGQRVEGYTTVKEVPRGKFEIVYFSYLFDLIDQLGNKKLQVLKVILEKRSYDNTLIVTTRELAKLAGVSHSTVLDTLKLLRDADIIHTRTGSIALNPRFCVRGSKSKEDWIFQKFVEFDPLSASVAAREKD